MSASCREIRNRLGKAAAGAGDAVVDAHLERCEACARFAARLRAARNALRHHHADVEPDLGFAGRVTTRLEADPAGDLGLAALRLLPATLVLLALLAWIAVQKTETPGSLLAESPTDDLLSWVAAGTNGSTP